MGHMVLDMFMFDCVKFPTWEVTDGCVRGKASVHPHISDDVVMHKVDKGDVLEFIGSVGMKKWIVLCELCQGWFEVVTIYVTKMSRVNGMKYFLWEDIKLGAIV